MRFTYRRVSPRAAAAFPGAIQTGALRWTRERIEELQEGRPVNGVNCDAVQSMALRRSLLARHPLLQCIFGAGWMAASLPLVIVAAHGKLGGEIGVLSVLAILVGGWVIFDAMRRGHYLEIHSDGRVIKLVAGRLKPEPAEALRQLMRSRFPGRAEG